MARRISEKGLGSKLHHRDIVGVALRRMRDQLNNAERDEVIADILKELDNHPYGCGAPDGSADGADVDGTGI